MHTVELLERALRAAEGLGYRVRQDWLDGPGAGCEIKGEKWLFLDLASSPLDQLDVVAGVLSRELGQRRGKDDATSHQPAPIDSAVQQFLDERHAA
ncbi:MAG TPA: hypothetical protein VHD36_22545 [Pirellulales bacterium]|nr:hypothetical protein [Pirellulales bacterium]